MGFLSFFHKDKSATGHEPETMAHDALGGSSVVGAGETPVAPITPAAPVSEVVEHPAVAEPAPTPAVPSPQAQVHDTATGDDPYSPHSMV